MTARERIARLEALLDRMLTRAAEPRARPVTRLSASAYDDIHDEDILATQYADDARDAHAITDRHGARPNDVASSTIPKSFGSTGWTMPPAPEEAPAPHEMTTKVTREMNAVSPGSEDARVPNTRELSREAMLLDSSDTESTIDMVRPRSVVPAMPPPPLILESVPPEARSRPEQDRAPSSVPPPISAPMFTPRPAAAPIEAELETSYAFTGELMGEVGTLVSRERPDEVDPDLLSDDYEMVDGVVEVEPDAEDDAVRPSMLPREAGFEDPQEITDVFESRSRLMAAPSVRPEELGELEILGEAEADDLLGKPEVEEAPISSRRAISAVPESGPQVASLSSPPPIPPGPNSMEAFLPVAQSPGEYRSDVYLQSRTMPAPPDATPEPQAPQVPTPEESRTAEIVRPRIDSDVQVAKAVGRAPAFQPATFGDLLDATLDL